MTAENDEGALAVLAARCLVSLLAPLTHCVER